MSYRTVLALAAILALTADAPAQVGYSNVTNNPFGFADVNGGAAVVGTNTITALWADDILVAPGFEGGTVTGFSFSVANFNTTTVSARSRVRFYAANGALGAPGTFIDGFDFNAVSVPAGSLAVLNFNPATPLFSVPANGLFWAGITFDNNDGATGATLAQLDNFGQGLYDPPTVGSSADRTFVTSTAGDFAADNPAGVFFDYGGFPVANLGWAFNVTPVPEPAGVLAASLLLAAAWARVRRRFARG